MKIDPNAAYDWIMLGHVSPKVRAALKRYGFTYNPTNGYWMRLSKDGLPRVRPDLGDGIRGSGAAAVRHVTFHDPDAHSPESKEVA